MKKKIIFITIILFLIDQITKYLVYKNLVNITLIKNFLSLKYVINEGVAFSFLYGKKVLIIIVSIMLLFIIIKMMYKEYVENKTNNYKIIIYGMLLSGILGNLFDRIIRGYVIDFISLNIFGYLFPVFNVADMLITISVILLLVDELFKKSKKAI